MFKKILLLALVSVLVISCGEGKEEEIVVSEVANVENEVENSENLIENKQTEENIVETTESEEVLSEKTEPVKKTKTYTLEKVASYNSPEKCRTIVEWKVYDITPFFGKHGWWDKALEDLCGKDGTEMFKWQHWGQELPESKLESMYKGDLVKQN